MKADRHPQEAARLGALRHFDILDTPREAEFDDVVNIAARLCGTPISVINLIDEDRQWFKAETGLGVRETPLDTSICAHVILEGEFVEIPDTLADQRMCDNPLCLDDPGLRFYAGVVLRTNEGHPIGTLCVLDNKPRRLDDLQKDTLRVLAAQVMAQLDLRLALRTEALLRKEIDHRVKNSLQMVASFAQIQRRGLDPHADAVLLAVVQQIGAVSLLHDELSHSDDLAVIDLAAYLTKLTDVLAQTVLGRVGITGSFEPLMASPATASALGTVINELVTNSLKHSFGIDGDGTISLTGTRADMFYRLVCDDDGAAKDIGSSGGGLGVLIMTAAVEKMAGSLTRGPVSGGFQSVVEFPVAF